jgi:hypothetical protein
MHRPLPPHPVREFTARRGLDLVDELLRSKSIVLLRYDQWFAYAGNGGGVVFFRIFDGPDRPPGMPNLGTAFFKPVDQAISDALSLTNPPSTA